MNNFYPNYDFLEICLILFDRCNLGCSFCFQEHTSIKTPEEIKDLYISLIPQLEEALKKKPWIKHLIFRIWGGEVFMDSLDDKYLEAYEYLQTKIIEWAKLNGYTTEFGYSSNLVFNKTDRIQDFLKRTNSIINTSYDPVERFRIKEQEDLWWANLKIFNPSVISITLTKPNIKKYLETDILKQLKDYTLYPEYYIYNKNWEKYAPSTEDLFYFYKYYYEHNLTNIPEINNLINSYQNPNGRYCICSNSCSFINNKLTFSCLIRSGTLDMLSDYGMTLEECMSDKCTEIQYNIATSNMGCKLCKHYSYCRLPCMASQLHKDRKNKGCFIAKLYEYLSSK